MQIMLLVVGAVVTFMVVAVAISAWMEVEPVLGIAGATAAVVAWVLWFGWHILDWDVAFEDWLDQRRKSNRG